MTATGPYSRVYHSLVDDPMFAKVYGNDAAFATWVRLLMIADALHPASAPLPRRNSAVRLLLDSGLIEERPGNRYVVRGLQAERERRSEQARNAAAKRWHSESSADAMPRREETRKEKKSNGANAPTFMGFRPKVQASAEDVRRQHEAEFEKCAQCGTARFAHHTDHEFAA